MFIAGYICNSLELNYGIFAAHCSTATTSSPNVL